MFRKRNRKMQCGFCTLLSNLLRSFMCIGSRRGSTESYYRELGDQDTLRPEDRSSHGSTSELDLDTQQCIGKFDKQETLQLVPIKSGAVTKQTCAQRKKKFLEELDNVTWNSGPTGRFMSFHRRKKRQYNYACGDVALYDNLLVGHVKQYLRYTMQWRFNAFALENVTGGKCLPVLCVHLFHSYGLMRHFKMDAERVWKLFSLLEEGYHSSNPYHNAIHAADVTQAMHCFLQEKKISEHMEPIELMSALIAAIAHDLDHPGVSQPFLIATSNHLATLYHNNSVLETHHWRSAVSCVLESRILINVMTDDLRKTLIRQVSSLILATDITRQQEYLSRFKVGPNHMENDNLDMTDPEHRHLVLQIALKCADISNPCRPWEISKKWSLKVCEEFFRQGDYERELNLPVTALCDRYTNSIPTIQTGFFKFVVLPLVSEWHSFLQSDLSKQMMRNLIYNQNKWEAMMSDELSNESESLGNPVPTKMVVVEEEDEEEYESGSISDSNERLLPLRRRSLNTKKVRRHERRFSIPLNLFKAMCAKLEKKLEAARAAEAAAKQAAAPAKTEEQTQPEAEPEAAEPEAAADVQAAEPSQRVASVVDDSQPSTSSGKVETVMFSYQVDLQAQMAARLQTAKEDVKKMVRQQTHSPLETPTGQLSPHSRSEDAVGQAENVSLNRMVQHVSAIPGTLYGLMKQAKEQPEPESSEEKDFLRKFWIASGYSGRRESAPIGSQLRDNLTSVQLTGITSVQERRKSMPAESLQDTKEARDPKETKMPELLARTLSGKEALSRRRGSAPAPVVADLLPGLRRGNGSRRKNPVASCKASVSGPEAYQSHRRSSLPVEAFRLTELVDKSPVKGTPPASQ